MASRTFGVNTGNYLQGPPTDPNGPVAMSFPGGEYQKGYAYPRQAIKDDVIQSDPIDLEGDLHTQAVQTPAAAPQQVVIPDVVVPPKPSAPLKTDYINPDFKKYTDDKAARTNKINALRAGAALLKATGGIINAESKYAQTKSQNNFNIQMADQQIMQVASEAKFAALREDVKGKGRANDALISAVGQGQSASGDFANKAVSSEEVYAAQNMMAIEINSMRKVFGIQSQIRQLQTNNEIAKQNRNTEMADSVLQGVASYAGSIQ